MVIADRGIEIQELGVVAAVGIGNNRVVIPQPLKRRPVKLLDVRARADDPEIDRLGIRVSFSIRSSQARGETQGVCNTPRHDY